MSASDRQSIRKICPECGNEYPPSRNYCDADGTELFEYTSAPETEIDPLIGAELDGRFRVLDSISSGAMGKIYRAEQTSVERHVAVKVMHSEHLYDDTAVKRFLREAQSIAKLSHPNIVRLVDFGQDAEHEALYLAMELIEGVNVAELLEEGRIRPSAAVELGKQICGALSASHDQGLIHRDLKPANAMLLPLPEGRIQAKIVDFGIAHAVQSGAKLTKTGMICGTPHYLAPEQATGDEVDGRADMYSLGILLYEMIAGEVPYDADQSLEIAFKHLNEPTPRLADCDHLEALPIQLSDLVERMMSKDAEDRPANILEVREALNDIQNEEDLVPTRLASDADRAELVETFVQPVAGRSTRAHVRGGDTNSEDERASVAEVPDARETDDGDAAAESTGSLHDSPAFQYTGEASDEDFETGPTKVTVNTSDGASNGSSEEVFEAEPTKVTTDVSDEGGEANPPDIPDDAVDVDVGAEAAHEADEGDVAPYEGEATAITSSPDANDSEAASSGFTVPPPETVDDEDESTRSDDASEANHAVESAEAGSFVPRAEADTPNDTAADTEENVEDVRRSTDERPGVEVDAAASNASPDDDYTAESTQVMKPPPEREEAEPSSSSPEHEEPERSNASNRPGTSEIRELDESTPSNRPGTSEIRELDESTPSDRPSTSEMETVGDDSSLGETMSSLLSRTPIYVWVAIAVLGLLFTAGAGVCTARLAIAAPHSISETSDVSASLDPPSDRVSPSRSHNASDR